MNITTGCPRVPESIALALIEEVEQHNISTAGAAVRALQAREQLSEPEQVISALTDTIIRDDAVSETLGETALALWPSVPLEILQHLTAWAKVDSKSLVFNRRKRRTIERGLARSCFTCLRERLGERLRRKGSRWDMR